MARLLNSQLKIFPVEHCNGPTIHKMRPRFDILRFIIIIGCVISFILNSYAIFRDFMSNPIIVSTKVLKSPDGSLLFPLIMICNESAFKQPIMATDFHGYQNNTLALNDFLIDILSLKDAGHAIIKAKPISIKHTIEELFTAFHGTCFMFRVETKVRFHILQSFKKRKLWIYTLLVFLLRLSCCSIYISVRSRGRHIFGIECKI